MFRLFRNSVLLLGALIPTGLQAQKSQPSINSNHIDVAITYSTERGKVASIDCGCFWLKGGNVNAAYTFYHGLGVAASFSGGHVTNFMDGVDLDKVSFMMGPRYTFQAQHWNNRLFTKEHPVSLFGEGLIGGVHAFNTVIPNSSGVQHESSSFAIQTGGGMDWTVRRKIGVRLFEVDYVRSALPNGGSDTQHDLRIGGGISFHFQR